jgi:hypothetical protein
MKMPTSSCIHARRTEDKARGVIAGFWNIGQQLSLIKCVTAVGEDVARNPEKELSTEPIDWIEAVAKQEGCAEIELTELAERLSYCLVKVSIDSAVIGCKEIPIARQNPIDNTSTGDATDDSYATEDSQLVQATQ